MSPSGRASRIGPVPAGPLPAGSPSPPLAGPEPGGAEAAPRPTWRRLLRSTEKDLGSVTEARWIVERASGWEGAELWTHLDDRAPERALGFAASMVDRRRAGEPLQYVLGRWGFRALDLLVDRRVLIPRPETETVVEAATGELRRLGTEAPIVVDLGTGSGAIGLAMASEVPDAQVWATDASTAALSVARANLAGVGSLAGSRVRLLEGSWWDALPEELEGRVDVVVCNPPYVSDDEELPPEVADWEPAAALRAGPSGLEALEVVVSGAPRWLTPDGALVVELAPHQAPTVSVAALEAGFDEVESRLDLAGFSRVVVGRMLGAPHG